MPNRKRLFSLPPEGSLEPNGMDDPLQYYYKPLVGRIYCARIEQALSLLKPPYKSILELGYGSGILLPTLCSLGGSVSGIDITSDPGRISDKLDRLGVRASLVRGDISGAHFSDSSFDLIVAISIFEHIQDPLPALEKVSDLLCPGGELLVGMPRVSPFMSKAFRLIGYDRIEDHHVTDHRKFLKAAGKYFQLVKFHKLPTLAPSSAAMYFNMLLRKPSTGE